MWYVIRVTSGEEYTMLPQIQRVLKPVGGVSLFVPCCIRTSKYGGAWHPESKVLFPGYLFADMQESISEPVKKALYIFTRLVEPVCIGGGFYPIRTDEQQFLQSLMDEEHQVGFSVGNIVDGELQVLEGPLKGKTEAIAQIDRHKRIAELRVKLWGEERRVKVGVEVKGKYGSTERRNVGEYA